MDLESAREGCCSTWKYIYGENIPKCEECKHYGCEAFRALKAEQERYEEDDHE